MAGLARSRKFASQSWRRIGLGIGLSLYLARSATADVDATGSWALTITLGSPISTGAIFAQSGSNLAVALDFGGSRNNFVGSIDAVTGAFTVTGTLPCPSTSPPSQIPFQLSGTVAADGATLTGTLGAQSGPSLPCSPVGLAVTGTHGSSVCGDGIIDPGETCDPGPLPSSDVCCRTTCTLAPAFTQCTDDGLVCTIDDCDGAGTCTHLPGNAGTVCRPSGPPCDTAEVCDGMNATCPADQPTCPPADIDVKGQWRITFAGIWKASPRFPPAARMWRSSKRERR